MKFSIGKVEQKVRSLLTSKSARRHALVGPVDLWKMKRDFQMDFLRNVAGLQPDQYFFDIGCGTLRGGIPLIQYLAPGHYYGVETRAETLREGELELKEHHLEDKKPVLICTPDLASLHVDQHFDQMWAFSVLIHMSDDVLSGCLAFVRQHLTNSGAFYGNVNLGAHQEGRWQGFPVVWRSIEFYEEMASQHGLSVQAMGSLESFGHRSGYPGQDQQQMLVFKIA